jgi:hypothetical protein
MTGGKSVTILSKMLNFSQKIYMVCLASAGDCQIFSVIATEVSKFEQTEIFLYVLNLLIYIMISS